jgi:Nitrogen regulatory protein PII
MEQTPETKRYELIHVIVANGMGSRVLQIAKRNGILGGTIFLGKGTVRNSILEKLALNDIQKEIVMMAADEAVSMRALAALNEEIKLCKPNHGIAYTMPIAGHYGSRSRNCSFQNVSGGTEEYMYQSITIIVDKGKGEDVVEAASKAGSSGATIINARGSGIHETSKLFAMEIEPEKEIVLIIAKSSQTDSIVSSIREDFHIDQPGSGVIFVQNVSRAFGLYE